MITIPTFANEKERKFANMKEKRDKPKSERKKQEIELVQRLIAQARNFLPTHYVEEVLAELNKKAQVPDDKTEATKRAIKDTLQGKSHKIDIAHAIFAVGMAYKAKFEEAEKALQASQEQP